MKTPTQIDPLNPPAVHEWTGPTGVNFRDVRSVHGTYYHDTTPAAIVAALDDAMRSKARIRLWYGDRETGKNWLEENDVCGTVGRSMGPIKTALLIANSRSMGGGAILADSIVCLRVDGREVFRHPSFKLPEISLVFENKHAHCPWAATVNGDPAHARFSTETKGKRWAAFMRGERAAK